MAEEVVPREGPALLRDERERPADAGDVVGEPAIDVVLEHRERAADGKRQRDGRVDREGDDAVGS